MKYLSALIEWSSELQNPTKETFLKTLTHSRQS
jgi:hypothetical protein